MCCTGQGDPGSGGAIPASGERDTLQYGPNPDALVAPARGSSMRATGEAMAAGTQASEGLYRPPRITPTTMEDDPDRETGKRTKRRDQERARRAARSTLLPDLAAELEGAPEEVSHL